MQKLIILDSETGVCHIVECPQDMEDSNSDEYELSINTVCDNMGINYNSCQYMIALEINDTTK